MLMSSLLLLLSDTVIVAELTDDISFDSLSSSELSERSEVDVEEARSTLVVDFLLDESDEELLLEDKDDVGLMSVEETLDVLSDEEDDVLEEVAVEGAMPANDANLPPDSESLDSEPCNDDVES